MFTGPVSLGNGGTFDRQRRGVAAGEVAAVQQREDNTQQVDSAALGEGAEASLARSWAANLQLSSLKVAVVKLNVAPGGLKASRKGQRTSVRQEIYRFHPNRCK